MSDNPESPPANPAPPPPPGARPSGPAGLLAWLPWVAATGFAVLAGFLSEAYFAARTELIGLREQNAFSAIEAQSLQQRLEAERILAARRIADLSAETSDEEVLAQCDFIPLHAPASADPAPAALVVWNPRRQAGILFVRHPPASPPGARLQLWIRDARYPEALDAGEVTAADAEGEIRLPFKPGRAVAASATFYITLAPPGTAASAEGRVVLTSR